MSGPQPADFHLRTERRREQRFECDLGITVEWGAATLPGRVRDISENGMFVALDGPLWIGARFAARLALHSQGTPPPQAAPEVQSAAAPQVAVECVVNRVDPRRGMAVTYAPTGEPSRAALASLLEGLAGR